MPVQKMKNTIENKWVNTITDNNIKTLRLNSLTLEFMFYLFRTRYHLQRICFVVI